MAIAQTPSPLSNVISSKTYNALWYQATGDTSETAISKATAAAATDGAPFVYIPAALFPYDLNLVTKSPAVSYVQESSVISGYGSPEGIFPAPVGWLYQQFDGLNGDTLWGKVTGTGTTGWSLIGGTSIVNALSPLVAPLQRTMDWTAIVVAGQNDADTALNVSTQVFGISPLIQPENAAGIPIYALVTLNNASPVLNRLLDQRVGFQLQNDGPTSRAILYFRPFGAARYRLHWRETYGSYSGTLDPSVPTENALVYMSYLRKPLGTDATTARTTFGFGNDVILTPSASVSRAGIIGDGLLGYRYGSVNCPDAPVSAENGNSDIDLNSVQPADLVNPGTNWWHTAIKLIPPTPTSSGKWAAYHNGVLVKIFDTNTNFPRGGAGTNYNYTTNSFMTYITGTDVGTGLVHYRTRMVETSDLTLGNTLTF